MGIETFSVSSDRSFVVSTKMLQFMKQFSRVCYNSEYHVGGLYVNKGSDVIYTDSFLTSQ